MKNTSKQLHHTIGLRGWGMLLVIFSVASLCAVGFFSSSNNAQAAYPTGCVSQACREAYDRAASSEAAARQAAANAETLEGEVARLNSEIAALEAEIAVNQAIADDLSAQIIFNQNKLSTQQAALAKLLVDMHFEAEPDAITLLASSSSLGDLAERQSRQANVQDQVSSSATEIKTIKEDLERQKTSIDALLEAAELSYTEISNLKARQEALIAKYENDSEAYARDAAAARETMQKEIAAEIAKYNSGGVVGEGYNSYPWAANCPRDNVGYIVVGGYVCQCTSYAGWKAQEYWGIYISSWGDARDWGLSAMRQGYVVDSNPAPHTVGYTTAGIYGHVVWVESVNANGSINISEYNNTASAASGLPGDFGARYNVSAASYQYIHFDQRRW